VGFALGGGAFPLRFEWGAVRDRYQSLFHVVISDGIGFAICGVTFISMVAVFVYAIRFRLRRRLLPEGFIAAEVLLGIIGAFLLFSLYGVLMYSIIG